MKVQSKMKTILFCASCLASTVLVGAEDNGNYNKYYNNNNNNNNANNNGNGNDNGNDNGSAYNNNGFSVCSDTSIEVQDVQIYCDSPGTFYYGSGKYRNSQNCTSGDKGKFLIDFYINDAENININGQPVLDIKAEGSIGWYERNQQVLDNADLCSLSSLKSLDGSVCPAAGKYRIKSSFYWDEDSNEVGGYYNPVFYPKLSVGIKSSIYQNTYDYGGANTPYCSGTTFFTSWTNNVKAIYADSVSNFFKSFGILMFTIAVMGIFIFVMFKRRPRTFQYAGTTSANNNETVEEISYGEPSFSGSEEFDFNKMKSPRANQSFLDF